MAKLLYGSICLSDVPKELFKKVKCKDGVERVFLNIKVVERKQQGKFGDTHFISCEPKKGERKDGRNYIIGDLKTYDGDAAQQAQEQAQAQPANNDNGIPFIF